MQEILSPDCAAKLTERQVDVAWRAEEIKRLDSDLGCFSAVVRRVEANEIVLLDGQTLQLGEGITAPGDLQAATVIILFGCLGEEGDFVIVTIIVIGENNQTLTCSGNSVTINGNENTITLLRACRSVTIRGNSNRVSVEASTPVTNTGNNNIIQQR